MVDEVAWGIGWGAEGDDAARSEAILEELEVQRQKSPTSRTHSTPRPKEEEAAEEDDTLNEQIDARLRPSLDAARRRSSSRLQRSLSRAPALSDRSSSAAR